MATCTQIESKGVEWVNNQKTLIRMRGPEEWTVAGIWIWASKAVHDTGKLVSVRNRNLPMGIERGKVRDENRLIGKNKNAESPEHSLEKL